MKGINCAKPRACVQDQAILDGTVRSLVYVGWLCILEW